MALSSQTKETILVADDEASIRRILETRLSMIGYKVVTASDGKEALKLFKDYEPDLVVLDVMMPKLDGYGVCQELKNIKNSKKSIPFNKISSKKISRFTSGFREFDRVLGGGIVPGSVVLLGGEPGIGKSTIVLQSAGKISLNEKVLYITAEESLEQVKIRWLWRLSRIKERF